MVLTPVSDFSQSRIFGAGTFQSLCELDNVEVTGIKPAEVFDDF